MTNQILQEKYEIQRQLGKNPGRKTLLAKDLKTQDLVVVKLLNFDIEFDWQDLKLFEREAQILEQLSHPAIPNYIDSFKVDLPNSKGFGLVQTYIPAQSLEEHLQAGRTFSEIEVKQIGKALLEVLIYLHSRQPAVIHRDIKPSNILLGNRSGNHLGNLYLVDFGAVKTTAQQQGGTMTVVGTYGYMAQEQFGGRSVPASDLYSLGATLIYLVTGSHPADLLGNDMIIQFEESVNLSSDFINWLKWMTQPTLKNRPSSAEVALEELENPTLVDSKLVVSQPKGSKVEFTKGKDELEILIPPPGFSLKLGLLSLLMTFQLLFLTALTVGSFGMILLLIIPILVWIMVLSGWLQIIFTLFGCIRLGINQEKMQITYELFGLKYRPRFIQKSDICKLEIVGRTIDKSKKGQPEIPSRLIIWTGTRSYELGTFLLDGKWYGGINLFPQYLSLPEIDWLAEELSDYLELPISRDAVSIKPGIKNIFFSS
ncbi:serine/threonine-protein kinase [Rivularia sp. UHCC 0363]|uniref:serine/threonine protein kinase n=1 Tax=Rivularia sp. UHCC 0363 TaxID=3110244 RepID=UPI002B202E11|nr:serine/threonine-protein kinase [Rivularia sp. UHCC 0363]MEA5597967.1 serine/threonine-protein kinase [Rivularia sp. UHCC 0363]